MNVQETLTQIDHIMTEVDLELWQWQADLDMMAFIGVNATIAMWTNEIPPRVVTSRNISLLPLQGIQDVRVMHFTDDGWTKVGTAKINESGNFVAQIDHDIPGITDANLDFSLDEFGGLKRILWAKKVTISREIINPNLERMKAGFPPFEGLNKPLTIHGLEEAIAKEEERRENRRSWILPDGIENHPFFNKEQ